MGRADDGWGPLMARIFHGLHRWRRFILVSLAILAFVAAGVAIDSGIG